jgi:putative component of toxin-antitoxin plasmid stabilization module
MIEVRQTVVFFDWLAGLRDLSARARIVTRIRRMEIATPAT